MNLGNNLENQIFLVGLQTKEENRKEGMLDQKQRAPSYLIPCSFLPSIGYVELVCNVDAYSVKFYSGEINGIWKIIITI